MSLMPNPANPKRMRAARSARRSAALLLGLAAAALAGSVLASRDGEREHEHDDRGRDRGRASPQANAVNPTSATNAANATSSASSANATSSASSANATSSASSANAANAASAGNAANATSATSAGSKSSARSGTAPAAYAQECGACHVAYPAGLLPAASWQRLMANLPRHFGTDASLDAASQASLSAWLVASAGTSRRAREAPPQDRITRTGWFMHEHDEIPAATFKRAAVKSASNCNACHARADQGDFNEHDVRIPR